MTCTKERILALIPLVKNIIAKTAANRDLFDASDDEKLLNKLKHNVALHSPLLSVSDTFSALIGGRLRHHRHNVNGSITWPI